MKRIFFLLFALLLLAGCGVAPKQENHKPKRVVSMMGSLADVWQLAGGTLVGVTEDAVSEQALSLPKDIAIIGTVKHPNIEKILALSPDLVLGSALLEPHQRASATLQSANVLSKLCKLDSFSDYLAILREFCNLTRRDDLYQKNGLAVQAQVEAQKRRVPAGKHPTVLLIRALSTGVKTLPLSDMTSIMLADLGAENIAAKTPLLLEELSMEEVLRADPDFILVVPMGNPEAAERAMAKSMTTSPAWRTLSAVKKGHYRILDRALFHYKPNARWGEAYETLYSILYPEA